MKLTEMTNLQIKKLISDCNGMIDYCNMVIDVRSQQLNKVRKQLSLYKRKKQIYEKFLKESQVKVDFTSNIDTLIDDISSIF